MESFGGGQPSARGLGTQELKGLGTIKKANFPFSLVFVFLWLPGASLSSTATLWRWDQTCRILRVQAFLICVPKAPHLAWPQPQPCWEGNKLHITPCLDHKADGPQFFFYNMALSENYFRHTLQNMLATYNSSHITYNINICQVWFIINDRCLSVLDSASSGKDNVIWARHSVSHFGFLH